MRYLQNSAVAVLALVAVTASLAAAAARAVAPRQATGAIPPIVREGRCYRIAFTIDSAPAYKVLELGEGGWLRAEVDAGSGQAQRQSFWVNTAQIVTIREQRCSE